MFLVSAKEGKEGEGVMTTAEMTEQESLLAEMLAEMRASEMDEDDLVPGFIDDKVDDSMTMWYVAYSTS